MFGTRNGSWHRKRDVVADGIRVSWLGDQRWLVRQRRFPAVLWLCRFKVRPPLLLRPPTLGPVSGSMDDAKNDDALFAARAALKRIGDDVRKPPDRLLISAGNTPHPPGRRMSQIVDRLLDPTEHPQRRRAIVCCDVRRKGDCVVQGSVRPDDIPHGFALEALSTVARKRRIAVLCGVTRPAFMSSIPRLMPSTIASSRST